jgi:CheY-like chemotaxis protein
LARRAVVILWVVITAMGRNMRVLLVDDDDGVRAVLARMLESRGPKVYAAACVDEARAALAAWPPDVVVTDLQGPGDVAALVRTAASANIPVVLLSGSDPAHLEETAGRLGAAAALQKPCRVDTLLRALDSLLAHRAVGPAGLV